MRRAIVHVGLPRTGTTTFQRLLASSRAALLAHGILYPDLTPAAAGERHLSHQHLGEALDGRRPRRDRRELLAALEAQLAATDAAVVLLSYERLCLIPWWRGVPRRLAALFARHGFAMEVLATVKPQAELLNSTYTWRMQFLREARTFGAYFDAEIGRRRWDIARLLAGWEKASDGRLTLVPVRDRRSEAPLVARILADAGLGHAATLFEDDALRLRENPSPGPIAIEVDRRLRATGAQRRFGPNGRAATRFVEERARLTGDEGRRFQALDPGRCARAEERWAASNDRLARRAWGEAWAARVASDPPCAVNELIAGMIDPDLERTIAALVRATLARFT